MDEIAYLLQSEYKEHGLAVTAAMFCGFSYVVSLGISVIAEKFNVREKALIAQLALPYAIYAAYVSFMVVLMVFFPAVWETQTMGPDWVIIGLIVSAVFTVVIGAVWQIGVYAAYKTVKLFCK